MDAYENGRTSYWSGLDLSANPYGYEDPQFDEWEDGWASAARADLDEDIDV